jgi:hypothetical protein
MSADSIQLKPYSVTRIEWLKESTAIPVPLATRIYAVEHQQNAVMLKWWKREIATNYTVRYGTTPGNYTRTIDINDNVATITNLQPGTTYYFVVTATNVSGSSGYSNEVTTRTAIPAQPVINYKHEDAGRISVHWESVPHANGYRIKYGTSSGAYTHEIDAGNVSGYLFRKMQNNQPYYFTVVAYNGYGESSASREISATPVVHRPWVPYLVNASENSNGTVSVSWTPSDSTYNATFNVYYCPTPWNDKQYQLIGSNVTGNTFTDFIPRDAGYHYYRVKAANQVGESQFYSMIATAEKIINGITGVDEITEAGISIYPNPVNNWIKIQSDDQVEVFAYRIFDSVGRLQKKGRGTDINVADCSNGLLIVEVEKNAKKYRCLMLKN